MAISRTHLPAMFGPMRYCRPGVLPTRLTPLILLLVALSACQAAHRATPTALPTAVPPPPIRLLAASLAPWQLPVPLSREVVVARRGMLLIAGGLDAAGHSASGVYRLNPASGDLRLLGTLPNPVHDAAGALIAGHLMVFGGGSVSSSSAVQSLSATGTGQTAGVLPQARSDLTSVSTARVTYLLGGYDTGPPLAAVLMTRDGTHFQQVARLQIPVRYAAATALHGRLIVFGGVHGTSDTRAIQVVDPVRGRVRIAAYLPVPLSHAAAFTIGDVAFVAGGRTARGPDQRIWSFDLSSGRLTYAGILPLAVSDAGVATIGRTAFLVGGEDASGPTTGVVTLHPSTRANATLGFPFDGRLLIADRGNNQLLLIDNQKRVVWSYPSAHSPAPPGGFYFPDDAFFTDHGRSIIVNEEQNQVIVRLSFPSGRLLWSYGHPGIAGSALGYLHEPDDAYLLRSGEVSVADDQNCRVLVIGSNHTVVRQIGTTGVCNHTPPTALGSPNGDTPLPNGNTLISEINGSWISEYTPSGQKVWSTQLPIQYPSDPQQIGPDRYLVADYAFPGAVYEFSRSGSILWTYRPTDGPGMLDHPSLVERLPNGLLIANDDYRHRIVVINPVTSTVVWQYGQTGIPGTGPNFLNTPDGLDLLTSSGYTPLHPSTG